MHGGLAVKNLGANEANSLLYPHNFSCSTMNEAHDLKGTEPASNNTRVLLNSASAQIVGIRELPVFNDTDYFLLGHRVMHGHHQAKDLFTT